MKCRVLFITPGCFDKGGISRYNRYQIRVLEELMGRSNVRVISLLGPNDNAFEEIIKTHWHGENFGIKDKFLFVWEAIKLAVKWKPRIILIGHVNLSGVGFLLSRFCRAITILNVYGLEVWSGLSKDAALGLRKVNHIISDCHNTAEYLINKNIRVRKEISVIWDCVDIETFYPSENVSLETLKKYNIPNPEKYFIILTLGRLSLPDALYKGYDRLLSVFAKISKDYPYAHLVIAGRGNYSAVLERKVAGLKLTEKVSFTGSIEERDLPSVYRSCNVFSLITESGEGKGEGIPLTPLEAMACGKVIVVGNQDGSREAIISENGYSIDPNALNKHEKILRKYIDDAEFLYYQSQNALKVTHENFSYEHFFTRHKILLEKIVHD